MRAFHLLLLPLVLVLVGASACWAAPKVKAEAGYANLYSPARPVPVRVHLSSPASEPAFRGALLLEAWQEEGGAPRCIHALQEVELGPGSAKSYLLEFRPDRSMGVRLRLFNEKGELVTEEAFGYGSELLEVPPGVPLVGTLRVPEGRTPLYWPNTYQHRKATDFTMPSGAVAVQVEPGLLAPGGLEGLSALVIGAGQSLEGEQLRALRAWLRGGGQLLIAPGSRPLDEDHPLSPLLPFTAKSQRRVRSAVAQFEQSGGEGSASLLTGIVRQGAWVTHAAPDGTPVLVTRGLGRGRVSLLTASLKAPALGSEEVRGALFERAFVLASAQPRGAGRIDVLEQASLHANLKTAESAVDRSWIVFLVLAFLLVVGPVDYAIWRWRPSPRMTWITLVASSLGFSALAFLVGTRGTGPGLACRSTWVVDCYPDGSAVVDGAVVVAGRRHSSFALKAEGMRFYPSGTPESGAARLQGDLLFGPGEVRFNLGLGACLPLRIRGSAPDVGPPVRAQRLESNRIRIDKEWGESSVDVFVVTAKGHSRTRVSDEPTFVSLSDIADHSRVDLPLVDEEGLMHESALGAGLWTTAGRTLVEVCEPGGFGGFSAFNDPTDAISWGLERSPWLARGHVVVIVKIRKGPGFLKGKDLPRDVAQGGVTYYRIHLPPQQESVPERSAEPSLGTSTKPSPADPGGAGQGDEEPDDESPDDESPDDESPGDEEDPEKDADPSKSPAGDPDPEREERSDPDEVGLREPNRGERGASLGARGERS
jgi:hypothetical protein